MAPFSSSVALVRLARPSFGLFFRTYQEERLETGRDVEIGEEWLLEGRRAVSPWQLK